MNFYKEQDAAELERWLTGQGQPVFRRKQIDEWLYHHWVRSFAEMTNLPAPLRAALEAEFSPFSLEFAGKQEAPDGTRKYLFRLQDGETVETVLIPALRRTTVCISTQVGCPVRCVFCASGQHGWVRNLSVSEIVDQVIYVCRELGQRVSNIVVMGIGEPLLNLDRLLPALEIISDPARLGFGARNITISTSGIVPGIRRLAEAQRQWNLALSLHAVDDETRRRLIPDKYRYPLAEVLAACRDYRENAGRMVTFEYALIKGRNDRRQDLNVLAKLAHEFRAKVNLIPCNPSGPDSPFQPPDRREVRRIADSLVQMGVQVSVRKEMGGEIRAACGQLRHQVGSDPQAKVD